MAIQNKMRGILGLFLSLVIALVISPRTIKNIYDTILGRLVLIGIIVFFTIHNVTLGLLVALIVIISSNMFLFEGVENMPVNAKEQIPVTAKELDIGEKKKIGDGVDPITIQESIKPVPSNNLTIPNTSSSDDVAPTPTSTKLPQTPI
jgi:hypothetical protein